MGTSSESVPRSSGASSTRSSSSSSIEWLRREGAGAQLREHTEATLAELMRHIPAEQEVLVVSAIAASASAGGAGRRKLMGGALVGRL
eukprot:COSAG01_NODE_52435_length_346_cov_4.000000_1_plen_87_part_01